MGQQEGRIDRAGARRRVEDIASMPTTPQPSIRRYPSRRYEAERSMSSSSPVVADASARSKFTRARTIDELDTRPPRAQPRPEEREEAPTVILPNVPAALSGRRLLQIDQMSWTAGRGANSVYAQRIAEPERRRGHTRSIAHPFDALRWWLLYPGRIEFLLWVMGAGLLIVLSVTLLPLTLFSFIAPKNATTSETFIQRSSATDPTITSLCTVTQQGRSECNAIRVTSPSGLEITLLNTDQVQRGAPLQLRGSGFTALKQVSFTCDTHWQCLPASLDVDAHGTFFVKLMPEGATNWTPGWHQITINDLVTRHSVLLPFILLSATATTTVHSSAALSSP